MINVGIAGIGFMGWIHYLAYQRIPGVRVAAIATRDPKKQAGDWRSIQGNFGPPGEQVDLSEIRTHRDAFEMVNDPGLDLVDLCLPPAQHKAATLAALAAGKHVFCEKPIALHAADAEEMVAAARDAGRQLSIGHVLPFFPEYRFACDVVESGRYGKFLGGVFRRIIAEPTWIPDFFDPEKVGGPLVDLHIHDTHFIRLLAGMPQRVTTQGILRDGLPELVSTQFDFGAGGPMVTAVGGCIRQQGRAFTHGFEIYLEQATLSFDFAVRADGLQSQRLTLLDATGGAIQPELGSGDPVDAFVAELNDVVSSVGRQQPSGVLNGALALDALKICEAEHRSLREAGASVML